MSHASSAFSMKLCCSVNIDGILAGRERTGDPSPGVVLIIGRAAHPESLPKSVRTPLSRPPRGSGPSGGKVAGVEGLCVRGPRACSEPSVVNAVCALPVLAAHICLGRYVLQHSRHAARGRSCYPGHKGS